MHTDQEEFKQQELSKGAYGSKLGFVVLSLASIPLCDFHLSWNMEIAADCENKLEHKPRLHCCRFYRAGKKFNAVSTSDTIQTSRHNKTGV
jgi:hypothetical protein